MKRLLKTRHHEFNDKRIKVRNGGEGGILPPAYYGRDPLLAISKLLFCKDLPTLLRITNLDAAKNRS
jgi:hypothetical protein